VRINHSLNFWGYCAHLQAFSNLSCRLLSLFVVLDKATNREKSAKENFTDMTLADLNRPNHVSFFAHRADE